MKRFLFIALLCAGAQIAWADPIVVTTDEEIRAAIQTNNANIRLGADIDLSNSTLSIDSGLTVTIDMKGHKLDRHLTQRGEGGGQVITVRSGATLNLSNGTLTGGWGGAGGALVNEGGTVTLTNVACTNSVADDRGGGICNREGGTMTLTNVTITGCISEDGGGILNEEGATLTINNGTLTNNQATQEYGGAITNRGTLALNGCTMTGNSARRLGGAIVNVGAFSMQGDIVALNNTNGRGNPDNIYVFTELPITISGPLTVGEAPSISVYGDTQGAFTSGYSTYNNGVDPATIFTTDLPGYLDISLDNNEVALTKASETSEYYVERFWDEGSKTVKSRIKLATSYTELTGGSFPEDASGGWYVVRGNVSYDHMSFSSTTPIDILLCDGARLNLKYLRINQYCNLHIYGQRNDEGALYAMSDEDNMPGIGSGGEQYQNQFRTIEIHGGIINAQGGDDAPGIGAGGEKGDLYEEIRILGGYVEAQGGSNAPGIGRGPGYDAGEYGEINIYGGTVVARGGADGAGIGGGDDQAGGVTNIYGGTIFARGDDGAGIGGGDCGNGGRITIHGGDITAEGWTDGSSNGAGIGGGVDGNGGTIVINGGTIHAHGGLYGAGIGGGEDGNGGDITINGGIIDAESGMDNPGEGYRAVGPGEGCDDYGKLTLGDDLMVKSERKASAGERKAMCWYRVSAHIEPCKHDGEITYTSTGCTSDDTHTSHCQYCNHTETEPHHFVNDTCTVCGVSAMAYSVNIYEPQEQAGGTFDGTTYAKKTEYLIAPGKTFVLPTCQTQVLGKHFVGWTAHTDISGDSYISPYEAIGSTLYHVGDIDTISGSVSFVARYRPLNLVLQDNASNGDTLAYYDGAKVGSATLQGRTLTKDSTWQMICLPFDLSENKLATSPLAGCELKQLDLEGWYEHNANTAHQTGFDVAGSTLYLFFKDTTAIAAGHPYVIRWTEGTAIPNPVFTGTIINNSTVDIAATNMEFMGIFSPKMYVSEQPNIVYLASDNRFVQPDGTETVTIGSFRAIIRLRKFAQGSSAAPLTIITNLAGVNLPTGVEDVTGDRLPVTQKFIRNGMLFIERGGRIYNAQGAQIR